MNDELKSLGFDTTANRIHAERVSRVSMRERNLMTGVPYLDAVWRGILPHDFVLIGAPTGSGKTEMITLIASYNARLGKRVVVFALEAEPNEIERRMLFQELTNRYYDAHGTEALNYRDWIYGDYDELLKPFEVEAITRIEELTNLVTFYRTDDFTIHDYEARVNAVQSECDLLICDHLQFFTLETENEGREMSAIMKKKRDLTLIHGIPQIVVSHLRKLGKDTGLVPAVEDFIGTSEISKIPTKIAILASGGPSSRSPNEFITYIRTGKFRMFNAPTAYIGVTTFDIRRNQYSKDYKIGFLSGDGKRFEELQPSQYPSWLKRGSK